MIHRRDGDAPLVALTFDDGPSQWTEQILDLLAANGARATFFVCGVAVEGREDTLRRCVAEGHEVANHTHTHPELRDLDRAAVFAELESASAAIESVTGARPRRFRPPYFESSPDIEFVSRELGFGEPIGADAWTTDWDQQPAEQMLAAITRTSVPDRSSTCTTRCRRRIAHRHRRPATRPFAPSACSWRGSPSASSPR